MRYLLSVTLFLVLVVNGQNQKQQSQPKEKDTFETLLEVKYMKMRFEKKQDSILNELKKRKVKTKNKSI